MQKNIIFILISIIFAIMSFFGIKEIKELKANKKQLETQVKALYEQTLDFQADLVKYNDEIINKDKEYAKLKFENAKLKKDDCAVAIISDDAVAILHQITSK